MVETLSITWRRQCASECHTFHLDLVELSRRGTPRWSRNRRGSAGAATLCHYTARSVGVGHQYRDKSLEGNEWVQSYRSVHRSVNVIRRTTATRVFGISIVAGGE